MCVALSCKKGQNKELTHSYHHFRNTNIVVNSEGRVDMAGVLLFELIFICQTNNNHWKELCLQIYH